MSAPKPNAWTDADVARLRELVAEGVSRTVIAKRMGRSDYAVRSALRRYVQRAPNTLKPVPADFADKWRFLSLDGLAEHYRVGRSVVQRWCGELGLKRTQRIEAPLAPFAPLEPVPLAPRVVTEADGCVKFAAAMDRLYARKARALGCSVEAARLVMNYSPAQLARMAA